MVEKKKIPQNPLGFGCSIKRFNNLGLHPELTSFNDSNPLGPGQYHSHYFQCQYKSRTASWQKKMESEEFSKFLGFRLPQLLADRQFDRTLRGPGSIDVVPETKKGASSFENVSFSKAKRFLTFIKDERLPPGVHNIRKTKTKFGNVPTFEWGGLGSRFKATEPKYRMAPNRYSLPHPCITDKVVSKRGPYDTFTGPRDQTTIKNHFAPPLFTSPDIFYPIPNALDYLLFHHSKQRCGKFLQALRFPPGATIKATKNGFSMYEKDQQLPSPADYEVSMGIKKEKETLHPFSSSNINARPPTNWDIHPGPDRYFIKYPKCVKKQQKNSWVFLTKFNRDLVKVESYSNFHY